jgi:hypothetical protein
VSVPWYTRPPHALLEAIGKHAPGSCETLVGSSLPTTNTLARYAPHLRTGLAAWPITFGRPQRVAKLVAKPTGVLLVSSLVDSPVRSLIPLQPAHAFLSYAGQSTHAIALCLKGWGYPLH